MAGGEGKKRWKAAVTAAVISLASRVSCSRRRRSSAALGFFCSSAMRYRTWSQVGAGPVACAGVGLFGGDGR